MPWICGGEGAEGDDPKYKQRSVDRWVVRWASNFQHYFALVSKRRQEWSVYFLQGLGRLTSLAC